MDTETNEEEKLSVRTFLSSRMQRPPFEWGSSDIEDLLDYIELKQLKILFRSKKMKEGDFFRSDFNFVDNKLNKKKLLNWREYILNFYNKRNSFSYQNNLISSSDLLEKDKVVNEPYLFDYKTKNTLEKLENTVPIFLPKKEPLKKKCLEIYSEFHKKTFSFQENGYIGRSKENKIAFDKFKEISSKHCLILQEETGHFIQDQESTYGTYILIPQNYELFLKIGMRIEIGSLIYSVDLLEGNLIEFKSLDNPLESFPVTVNGDCLIGRDKFCHIKFTKNEKLKDKHAVIQMKFISKIKKYMMIMKPNVPEGIWLQLEPLKKYPLRKNDDYRLGFINIINIMSYWSETLISNDKTCVQCHLEKNNVMIFPCQHVCVCSKCIDNRTLACPECFGHIHTFENFNL